MFFIIATVIDYALFIASKVIIYKLEIKAI